MNYFYPLLLIFCSIFFYSPKATSTTKPSNISYGMMSESDLIFNSRMEDSLALVALYNATGGANWTNTWDLSTPLDTWFGITSHTGDRVNWVVLDNNNLVGELPQQIENLTALSRLELFNNNLTGTFPTQVLNITNLRSLILESNNLTGNLPSNIDDFIQLDQLLLGNNNFTGNIPTAIGNLTSLNSLNLSSNNLSGSIPAEISQMSFLGSLNLSNNQLTGSLPSNIGDLTNLHRIELNDNNLSGNIPASIANLELFVIGLSGNNFSGSLPTKIGNIENLQSLNIADNNLSGELPASLANPSFNFYTIFAQNNNFSGCFPESFTAICGKNIDFSNNPLLPFAGDFNRFCAGEEQVGAFCNDSNENTLNDEINADCACVGTPVNYNAPCRTTDSLALVAFYNALNGDHWNVSWDLSTPLHTWFGVETNENSCVSRLSSINNGLQGYIPDEIGDLTELESLELNNNGLTGSIPAEIGNLSKLVFLGLYNNQLSGSIPSSIGNLTELQFADLYRNQLTSSIPTEIGNLTKLRRLDLFSNQLSGAIPTTIGDLAAIERLYLNNNQLTGNIPTEIGNLNTAFDILLTGNQLTGSIPTTVGNLTNIQRFEVQSNKLTGSIPTEFGNCINLQRLILAGNRLSGSLPSELGDLNAISTLQLHENQLSGCIPTNYNNLCGKFVLLFGNPLLPWQGDFFPFCNDEEQIGASCDNPLTLNDVITADCECIGTGSVYNSPCRNSDSLALFAIHTATHDNGTWKEEWDLSQPIHTWEGIATTDEGCVRGLFLSENGLAGDLPTEIGDLNSIEYITIVGEQLSSIPAEIGMLSNLRFLNLRSSNLTGNIPTTLGNLSQLQNLLLSNNQLTGSIPNELGNCTNLSTLELRSNQLSGSVPSELSNCIQIRFIDLGSNQLKGDLPDNTSWTNLSRLDLSHNDFSGCYPDSYTNLCGTTSSFFNNPQLPWRGSYQFLCNGAEQTNAWCTKNEQEGIIDEDCDCQPTNPLAVQLLDFTAKLMDNDVVNLHWQTMDETSAIIHTLRRSYNGNDWESIYTTSAYQEMYYNFKDNLSNKRTLAANVYYQLQLMDTTGKIIESPIRRVNLKTTVTNIKLYPNPAINLVTITLPASESPVLVELIATDGRRLSYKRVDSSANTMHYTLPLTGVPAGVYQVRIHFPESVATQKLIVK